MKSPTDELYRKRPRRYLDRQGFMSRRFTDFAGVEWRVEWQSGEVSRVVPPNPDIRKIPRPPGGMHFDSADFAFVMRISAIDPNDLTELELQCMIGDNTVH